MNTRFRFLLPQLLAAWIILQSPPGVAQEVEAPPASAATAPSDEAPAAPAEPAAAAAEEPSPPPPFRGRFGRNDGAVVAFGSEAVLPAGEYTNAVVAIMGSATSAGDVSESVVSILGNTRVTGSVGESAVAILGNVYVDGEVDEQVVAILGNVELGPNADVGDDVVIIGGTLLRDAGARVGGEIQNVAARFDIGDFGWLRTWMEHCLLYARPLALEPGLGWAWTLALGFLGFYILLALLFGDSVEKCVATLENQPGRSLLAALLSVLLTPILFLLLVVTVIGIAVVPFLAMALFFAGLFGKMVMLAWLGRRITRPFGSGSWSHPALAVLLGGIVVLALYLVPVAGFIVYKALGILGLGVVLYTILLAWQTAHPPVAAAGAASVATGGTFAQVSPATASEAAGAASAQTAAAGDTRVEVDLVTASLPRAGFWIRMAALLLDAILIGILLAVIDSPGSFELLLLAIYGAVMWKLKGTTVGGIVCGLKVVRLDGRPIDWPTAIVRALGCFLSLAVAGLGFIWVAFDDQKQSWHDKIAGTTIVRVPKGVSLL